MAPIITNNDSKHPSQNTFRAALLTTPCQQTSYIWVKKPLSQSIYCRFKKEDFRVIMV